MSRSGIRIVVLAVTLATVASRAGAADISKKWRISLAAGGFNPVDSVSSSAANTFIIREIDSTPRAIFEDPRNDSAAFGRLDIKNGPLMTLAVQYAVNKVFLVEASVGYEKSDVGDVALDVQFVGNSPPNEQVAFVFDSFRVPVGELERIPIQLTAIARFRPRASFNPYVGAGIGYAVHGFTTSDELNALSLNMDAAEGTQMYVLSSVETVGLSQGDTSDLSGATIDVRDTFEWHLVTGAEFSFKKHWAVFGEVRWTDASRELSVGFNGGSELGISVPEFEDAVDSERSVPFLLGRGAGPMRITTGLIDAGQRVFVRRDGVSEDVVCDSSDPAHAVLCEFDWIPSAEFATDPRLPDDFEPDGGLDGGFYYAQGGSVSYSGFAAQIGVRFTF